jgi:hypothetical protein
MVLKRRISLKKEKAIYIGEALKPLRLFTGMSRKVRVKSALTFSILQSARDRHRYLGYISFSRGIFLYIMDIIKKRSASNTSPCNCYRQGGGCLYVIFMRTPLLLATA